MQAGDAVFVIKPSGWMTPVDPATQLPRFSHLHLPEGTPAEIEPRFAGLAPTGALPDSINFGLRRHSEPAAFNVILFTDTQPESLAEDGYIRDDVVAQTAGITAAFGITHGDVMFDDLSYCLPSRFAFARSGMGGHERLGRESHQMRKDHAYQTRFCSSASLAAPLRRAAWRWV